MFELSRSPLPLETLEFPWPVWKVRVDPVSGVLGVELRDAAARTVGFYRIEMAHFSSMKVEKADLIRMEESWWVGLEAVRGDSLFLHGHGAKDLPMHFGIYCLDASGWLQWSRLDRGMIGMVQ